MWLEDVRSSNSPKPLGLISTILIIIPVTLRLFISPSSPLLLLKSLNTIKHHWIPEKPRQIPWNSSHSPTKSHLISLNSHDIPQNPIATPLNIPLNIPLNHSVSTSGTSGTRPWRPPRSSKLRTNRCGVAGKDEGVSGPCGSWHRQKSGVEESKEIRRDLGEILGLFWK